MLERREEPELPERPEAVVKLSKTLDEDTVTYGTAGKDTRFHE